MISTTPILIVGPSGIGKTAVCESVESQLSECAFADLDLITGEWAFRMGMIPEPNVHRLVSLLNDPQLLLGMGLQTIGAFVAERPSRRAVVNMGAGFQVGRSAEHLHKLFPMITITATREIAYARHVQFRGQRNRDEFYRTEFNDHRCRVYASAAHQIDSSSQLLSETASALREAITRTICQPGTDARLTGSPLPSPI